MTRLRYCFFFVLFLSLLYCLFPSSPQNNVEFTDWFHPAQTLLNLVEAESVIKS